MTHSPLNKFIYYCHYFVYCPMKTYGSMGVFIYKVSKLIEPDIIKTQWVAFTDHLKKLFIESHLTSIKSITKKVDGQYKI